MPAREAARNVDGRKLLPPGVRVEILDLRHGAAIASGAIIFFKTRLQRLARIALKLRVDSRADRHPAAIDAILGHLRDQFSADLFSEIVVVRRGEAIAFHQVDRNFLGGLGLRFRDIPVLGHFADHDIAPERGAFPVLGQMARAWRGRERRDERGFLDGQFFQVLAEIGQTRRRHAIGAPAEKNLVEIKLEDAILGEILLDPVGEDRLLDLALIGALARQKEVLHHLLGDARGAAKPNVLALKLAQRELRDRLGDGEGVDAGMGVEVLVFGADDRVLHQIRNFFNRGEQAALARIFGDDIAIGGIGPAHGRRFVFRQALRVRQIRAEPPDGARRRDQQDDKRHSRVRHQASQPIDEFNHSPQWAPTTCALPLNPVRDN